MACSRLTFLFFIVQCTWVNWVFGLGFKRKLCRYFCAESFGEEPIFLSLHKWIARWKYKMGLRLREELSELKMAKLKGWKYFRRLSVCSTKSMLLKVTSHFGFKPKGFRNELLDLYKDMESCGEYEDIKVMWRMIQSSSPQYAHITRKNDRSPSYWLLCFTPT
ncbi:uncharacterized protein LOC129290801 [Prosopis cineraria]|uniref:uncharacterized protein LOC129290801 n=1 Tax=Prosopis cineraria TaxID=364024 RepID=UPI00240FB10E|nr:uncharacterized protein LOC129290801 [Prosopis cineraria]